LSSDGNKGTGIDKIVKLFDCSKRDVRKVRRSMYVNGYKLDSEDERRAKISLGISFYRANETSKQALDRVEKSNYTKSTWDEQKRESVFGKSSLRSQQVSYRRKKFLSDNPDKAAEMIERFINAPKHTRNKPNKVEQNIINLQTALEFVGNGKYFVTFTLENKKCWHKNPDFIFRKNGEKRASKVVEVMDFEYWHTKEEADLVVTLYKNIKISCLIIDAKRCYSKNDLDKVKKEIESFLYCSQFVE
jgi:hypothetical protein